MTKSFSRAVSIFGTVAFVCSTVFSITGCGSSQPGPNVRELTEQELSLVQSSNRFGFELFSEVIELSDGGDVFISPLSVSLALGMTYNGARSSTEEGMRETLEFGELSSDEINQGFRGLIDYLVELDPQVQMEIANSIWYRDGFDVVQTFVDLNVTFFDALVTSLDFSNPSAADTINAWVDEKTHGKIDSIVEPPIDPSTVMFLINAVYFKGTWTYEFDKDHTSDGVFHAADGQDKTVKMMSQHAELAYLETEDFQAINLPYGHELFSMTIFLPKASVDIDELAASFDEQKWTSWMNGLQVEEGTISMPRFELEYKKTLNDVLIALGMGVAFSGEADFSGIRESGGLYISKVKHKSYVKVDEEGTEAAAVTSVEMNESSAAPGFTMQVNRPFLFAIHDSNSKAMLFMGKIVDPVSE